MTVLALKEYPSETDFPHVLLALPVTGWHTSLFSIEGEKLKKAIKGVDTKWTFLMQSVGRQ